MAIERELNKQRSARFGRTQPKRPNVLQRWKTALAVLAGLGAAAWTASALAVPGGSELFSRGRLAEVHAQWDQQCQACHTQPFVPVNDNNSWLPKVFGKSVSRDTLAAGCQHCHAGAPHVSRQKADDPAEVACGTCHRDHQGRDNTLVRTSDTDCVRCHAGLKDHTADGQSAYQDVRDWPTHPEFRPEIGPIKTAADRTLKFSHQLHMTAGQGLVPDSARPWTFGGILDLARTSSGSDEFDPLLTDYFLGQAKRYMSDDQKKHWAAYLGPDAGAKVKQFRAELKKLEDDLARGKDKDTARGLLLVKLDCASCHVLDGGDTKLTREMFTEQAFATVTPPRQAGWYFLPTVYDAHCKGCHPTQVQVSATQPKVVTPHRVQPAEMNDYLWKAYVRVTLADKPKAQAALVARSRLDPVGDDADQIAEAARDVKRDVAKASDWIYRSSPAWKQEVSESERLTYLGTSNCGKCHDYVRDPKTADPERPAVPTAIKATNIPTVWQQHAKFSHVAHRAMNCQSCHEQYYPAGAKAGAALVEKEPVEKIAGSVESCKQCHGPARTGEKGLRVGGVRHDCVECHSYHHRDDPLAGLGTVKRDPATKWDLEQMLHGKFDEKK